MDRDERVIVFQCATQSTLNPEPAPEGTVFVFSPEGDLLGSEEFSFGWSLFPDVPRWFRDEQMGRDLIEVSCASNKRTIGRQLYVLVGNRLELIRLEDPAGLAMANRYKGHAAGAHLTTERMGRLEKGLFSTETVEVLASLVWLGGDHWEPRDLVNHPDSLHTPDAAYIAKLRGDPDVRDMIAKLTGAPNQWIREEARLAQITFASEGK